jgi:glycosyltransferase involved in cell wall biosynthesis
MNEALNVEHVFSLIPTDVYEVLLVDGHSVDDTVATARACRSDVRVVTQNRCGKGNALACGFAAARGDIIVMLDCDGSTDPTEIPRFVEALTSGADFAKGSRFIAGGYSHDITMLRRAGNRLLNTLVNVLFGTRYSDLCYGYNAFWRSLVPNFAIPVGGAGEAVWGDGFEIETVINVRVARAGARVTEVASIEHARVHGNSNLNTWRDGLRVLRTIVRERIRLPGYKDCTPGTIGTAYPAVVSDERASIAWADRRQGFSPRRARTGGIECRGREFPADRGPLKPVAPARATSRL